MNNLDIRNVKIVVRWREGVAVSKISTQFNLTTSHIYNIINKHKRLLRTLSQDDQWVVRGKERRAELRRIWLYVANVDPFNFKLERSIGADNARTYTT